jgi:hypothetical protein
MRLLPLLLLVTGLSAQETLIRQVHDPKTDTHVEVTALFSEPSRGGFLPVRVKISNNLKTERSIKLAFSSSPGYRNGLNSNSTFGFKAPANKTVTQDIMVPLCSSPSTYQDEQMVSVRLTGGMGETSNTLRAKTGATNPAVLLSEALFTPNASLLDAEIAKRSGSGSSYGNVSFAGKFDPKQLPSDWLAFSGYDCVMLNDNDWTGMPAGSRNAILSWVRLGGRLIVFSSNSATPASLGLPESSGYGSTEIRKISLPTALVAADTVKLVGSISRTAALRSDFNGGWPLQNVFGTKAFNYAVFVVVLILFGILVGPVNLFVFAKSGQRHRLFVTTPVISLVASLILVVLIIFQDGFGGRGVRRVLMEVGADGGQSAAYLHQEQFSRTGILTGGRFTVDPACLFVPVPISQSRWSRYTNNHNTAGAFNLQPSGGRMDASGDWWQSRSEHGHALSAVISTRGRIESTTTPGQYVSTFDFPIGTFYFLDDSKQWQRASDVVTGKPFTTTPVDATMVEPELAREAAAFTNRNKQMFNRAKTRPGHFVALTESGPAINTLPGIRWKETRTVITGAVVKP